MEWIDGSDTAIDGESAGNTSGKARSLYRFKLDSYWRDWQRAAVAAGFDFQYLETLTDARALRFYELTKLWRAGIPDKMEIEYAKFAGLMPLPIVKSEREIKPQIEQLVKLLKQGGYLKSFAVKPDLWRNCSRYAHLRFRFDD